MPGLFKKTTMAIFFAMGTGSSVVTSAGQEDLQVFVIEKDQMTFGVSSSLPENSDFFVNSNFFDAAGPIGLVVENGKRINPRVPGGGFFYVDSSGAHVDSSSPTRTTFNSQTLLSIIEKGEINTGLTRSGHGKSRTYRTLIGETRSGDIVFIASSRMGLVTISEIAEVAIRNNVYNGILLDGGSSVDYRFGDTRFKSMPGPVKNILEIQEPKTYIYGNFNDN